MTPNLITATPRRFIKSITFDGAAGSGAVGTVAVATITGSVLLKYLTARVLTTLVGAATLELGTAADINGLIAQVAPATNLADGDFWIGSASPAGVGAAATDLAVEGNAILTVGSANITAGKIEIVGFWLPLSADGNMA